MRTEGSPWSQPSAFETRVVRIVNVWWTLPATSTYQTGNSLIMVHLFRPANLSVLRKCNHRWPHTFFIFPTVVKSSKYKRPFVLEMQIIRLLLGPIFLPLVKSSDKRYVWSLLFRTLSSRRKYCSDLSRSASPNLVTGIASKKDLRTNAANHTSPLHAIVRSIFKAVLTSKFWDNAGRQTFCT